MGTISLEHGDRLFWLGRYTERSFTTLKAIRSHFDKALDENPQLYQKYLSAFSLPDLYGDRESFLTQLLFDKENQNSVAFSLRCAYDNGIVLREDISTESLAYLQLAMDKLDRAKEVKSLLLELLALEDIFYGFWGCLEDHLYDLEKKALIDCGQSIERLDLYFRLHYADEKILLELKRFFDRLRLIPRDTPYRYNTAQLSVLVELMGETDIASHASKAISSLSRLFEQV